MRKPDFQPATKAEFSKAEALLKDILGLPSLRAVLEDQECFNAAMVYTRLPTLWLLVMQRLGGGLSLSQAVAELLQHHRDLLPNNNKRVREGTLSENNSAAGRARQRIELSVVETFSRAVCNHLASLESPVFDGRRAFIIDGTTITLPPTSKLKKAFPPASNQLGQTVWPVAMLVVAHELQSGCLLVPQIAPMYGPKNRSESSMALSVIDELPEGSIVMADSGFGIFSMAYRCVQKKHPLLFRLTKPRFKALKRSAALVAQNDRCVTYHLVWNPSRQDRKTNPMLPEDAAVEVFLHQVRLPNGETLELVSNIEVDGETASDFYRRRYDVEFDIRDFKVTMNTENIRALSPDTMMKELMGSVIAFNLVTQFRRQAAQRVNLKPRELSFRGVWTTFQYHLLQKETESYDQWLEAFEKALGSASRRRLPKRASPRSYPRAAHPRRPKTTKSQKSQRRKALDPPTSTDSG